MAELWKFHHRWPLGLVFLFKGRPHANGGGHGKMAKAQSKIKIVPTFEKQLKNSNIFWEITCAQTSSESIADVVRLQQEDKNHCAFYIVVAKITLGNVLEHQCRSDLVLTLDSIIIPENITIWSRI